MSTIRFGTCEIFHVPLAEQTSDTCFWDSDENAPVGEGWFYWCRLPRCRPEGDPIGPFKTRSAAYIDACDNGYIAEEDQGGAKL